MIINGTFQTAVQWTLTLAVGIVVGCEGTQPVGGAGVGTGGTGTTGAAVNAYPSGAPIPIEDLNAVQVEVVCKILTQCFVNDGFVATIDGCKAMFAEFGEEERIALVKAGKIKYDAAQAGKCLQAMGASCTDKNTQEPAACKAAFVGTAAEGQPCTVDEFCASRRCEGPNKSASCPGKCASPRVAAGGACAADKPCDSGLACAAGKCVAVHTGKAGDACSTDSCASGLFCATGSTGTSACAALLALGSECLDAGDCATGLFCSTASGPGPGKCTALAKAGETCTTSAFEEGAKCLAGLVCVAKSDKSTCVTRAKIGEACTSHAQCGAMDLECSGGTCKPLPKKGQPCTPADMQTGKLASCMPPFVCSAGVCGDPPGAGKPCVESQCASSLVCASGTCKAMPGKGEPCDGSCAEGLTCAMDTAGQGTCQPPLCSTP